ncbi:GGDEF domain-containing protein [Weissella viridescens]|nr:GGDEF domain-containing protein [Weissella viridescens]
MHTFAGFLIVLFFITSILVALVYVYQNTLIYSNQLFPKVITIILYIVFTYLILILDANLVNRLILYFVPLLFISLDTALWKVIFCASIHPWLMALYIGRYISIPHHDAKILFVSEIILMLVLAALTMTIQNKKILAPILAVFFACLEYWQSYQFKDILTPKSLIAFVCILLAYLFFAWLITYINKVCERLRNELFYDKSHDALTHVYNYHQLTTDLFQKAPIANRDAWIIIMDIDKFKSINDTYGHQHGNLALKLFANVLKTTIAKDIPNRSYRIYRYGGEEFVLLISSETDDLSADQDVIASVLKHFQKNLYEQSSISLPTPITYSAGVSHTVFHNYHTLRAFEKADLFLYQSKFNGRNLFSFDEPQS